jgi:signal transduction histidine kinase
MHPSVRHRLVAVFLVAAWVLLLGFTAWRHGLVAQADVVVIFIVPLLFAGLVLGRAGIWVTMASYLPILALGTWVDSQAAGGGLAMDQALSTLAQPMLASLIVALILDRLASKMERGKRLNRDLAAICARLEDEIREHQRSQMQLVHSQRVDALGRLASGVAHDFSNLLAVVLGYVHHAERVAGDNGEIRGFLDDMKRVTRRGQDLNSKLLTLARSDELDVETFDAGQVIERLLPLLRRMFAPGVVLRLEPATAPAPVRLDRAGFEAVLLNMAKNADDALDGRGEFRLRTTVAGDEVCVLVEDTGRGMTAETATRAFEPFFSTKPRGQGTGIGLATAYRVVTEAGGRIDIDSSPGEGARFSIRLPLASAPQASGINVPGPPPAPG